jgi:hypothetical protein
MCGNQIFDSTIVTLTTDDEEQNAAHNQNWHEEKD